MQKRIFHFDRKYIQFQFKYVFRQRLVNTG